MCDMYEDLVNIHFDLPVGGTAEDDFWLECRIPVRIF